MEISGGPKNRKRRKATDTKWLAFLTDKEAEEHRVQEWHSVSLADVGLPVRIINTLEDNDIFTVGDLCTRTLDELQQIPNLGAVTIQKCQKLLEDLRLPNRLNG